jgi:hypothetical protein
MSTEISIFAPKSIKKSAKLLQTAASPLPSSARGGLEPHFRVLVSAIFHGVSMGNFHQGGKLWNRVERNL